MPATLIVRSGGTGQEAALSITLDSPMIVIGRGEGCDVRLPDPSVSHRHATLRQRGAEYIILDEGSTNGTVIGGVRLASHAARIVKHGELIRVGRVWLEVRFDEPVAPPASSLATKELALALVARALDAQGERVGPRILGTGGADEGKVFDIAELGHVYVMGRGREVDFPIDDAQASRKHVQVVRRAEHLMVRDLASKNGVTLNGAALATDRDVPWRRGEVLQVGDSTFAFENAAAEALLELESAADEKIRPDEAVGPPSPSAPAPNASASSEGAAPMVNSAPTMVTRHPRRSSGWTSTDFVVVLLALSVLGLSALGLYWLFRG